jgi:hypothetical protein
MPAWQALGHCQRMLIECAAVLLQPSACRRLPAGWSGSEATFRKMIDWLVRQCGATQTECRHACYRLLELFVPLVPAAGGMRCLPPAALCAS